MKTAWLILLLAVSAASAKVWQERSFGTVRAENRSIELGVLSVMDWHAPDVVARFDSALAVLRFKQELVLELPRCADADSGNVIAVLGRLTGEKLDGIEPRGEWQFGQAAVILLPDSAACPRVQSLNNLRWIDVRYGSDLRIAIKWAKLLGEMFRERQMEEMNFMFHK